MSEYLEKWRTNFDTFFGGRSTIPTWKCRSFYWLFQLAFTGRVDCSRESVMSMSQRLLDWTNLPRKKAKTRKKAVPNQPVPTPT
jgi:hypothetical protein